MRTTTYLNDTKQDYRHVAFFSPSESGLGYSTLPREAFGGMGYDAKPEDMSLKDWLKAWDTYEQRVEAMKMRGEWERDY